MVVVVGGGGGPPYQVGWLILPGLEMQGANQLTGEWLTPQSNLSWLCEGFLLGP